MGREPDRQVHYSDGDAAERDVLNAITNAADVSLESVELMQKVKDLPSYNHLGIGRSVILRCLDLPVESRVLELGAGCGAITRYLGETFASVEAIEASPIRARIALERCRGLDNVSVVCKNLRNENFSPEYDIAVIVGVLEYAPVFIYPNKLPRDACLRFLKLARSALNENGNLVLAIENRIGLDYWAGAPEKHTGRPYDGIHDYPNAGSPVTFTRTELQDLLADAGFSRTAFYFCYPDYHHARTILSSTGDEKELFLHNWLDFPDFAHSNSRKPAFNRSIAAKSLGECGMLREFANAFLVVAGNGNIPTSSWVARRYDMRRTKRFRIVTTLYGKPKPFIRKMALQSTPRNADSVSNDQIQLQMGDTDWFPGNLLTLEIERAAQGRNFAEVVKGIIERYHSELKCQFDTGEKDTEGYPLLNSASLDANFANIIQDDAGKWHFIDKEWQTKSNLPIDFVIYRSIRFCLYSHGFSDRLARLTIRSLYPSYSRKRHKKNRAIADGFQQELYHNVINPMVFKKNLLGRIVRNDFIRPYMEKVWFRTPQSIRSFIRKRLL